MGRQRKTGAETWTDEERLALFREKGAELLRHPFVRAYLASRGGGFSLNLGPPNADGLRLLTTSIRGACPMEVQAVEALARLFYLKTEPIALEQIGAVTGRIAPEKAAAVKALLKAYRYNLSRRPGLGPADMKTTGFTNEITFGRLLDLHFYGNATHVKKEPRMERTRILGNQIAELLFGQYFYQQALFTVVAAVKGVLDIMNGAPVEAP